MPTEAQPTQATSILPSATLTHVVGAHTGSGIVNMARKILQTQLKQKCKTKSNCAKLRFGHKQEQIQLINECTAGHT